MIEAFGKLGVTTAVLVKHLGKPLVDLKAADMASLRELYRTTVAKAAPTGEHADFVRDMEAGEGK